MSRTRDDEAWFEQLFGFVEHDWARTQAEFVVEGTQLRSRANGRSFAIGGFTTPTLTELRTRTNSLPRGRLTVRHEVVGDVLELHARPENRGAVFQVASQLNCLEFAGPEVVPEDGVTGYALDPTQGPACSLAAAAATVYRNYFAPVAGGVGQRADRQIDTLDGLARVLGELGEYWQVENGYTSSDDDRLTRLERVLAQHDRDALLGAVRIGVHADVGVTFAKRFVEPTVETRVTQAFCSAISCGYSRVALDRWAPLATLVLDAAYEATLRAAMLGASEGGPRRVWLTLLGGGAFGNRIEWITGAIGRALGKLPAANLDVCVAHYRRLQPEVAEAIDRARGSGR